jgi:hypothetical protein
VGRRTVVIPIKDRAEQLEHLLTRLRPRIDCLLVGDASLGAAAIADVARRHGAQLIRRKQNTDAAAARNTGLRHFTTPSLAFVDSDAETDPSTLTGLAGHFADPRVVAVTARPRPSRCGTHLVPAVRRDVHVARPRHESPWSGLARPCLGCRPPVSSYAGTRSATGSTSPCAWPRTSTSSVAWWQQEVGSATTPPSRCATRAAAPW